MPARSWACRLVYSALLDPRKVQGVFLQCNFTLGEMFGLHQEASCDTAGERKIG
jgi:hypothetical protein